MHHFNTGDTKIDRILENLIEVSREISEKEGGGRDDFLDIYNNTNYAKSNNKNRANVDLKSSTPMVKPDEDRSY